MRVAEKYSHLNGEEYLLVHRRRLYEEVLQVIDSVRAEVLATKVSKERRKQGKLLYDPRELNLAFRKFFREAKWEEKRYSYYVSTDRSIVEQIACLPLGRQKELLAARGVRSPILSFKQTDFVKDEVAVEVQFGKYAFVAYDLFVKHMLFYAGGLINVGVEVLPVKAMQSEMSSGIAYYEGEVYKILRQGRSSPPVPLLILGVAP